jgi:serine protease Do
MEHSIEAIMRFMSSPAQGAPRRARRLALAAGAALALTLGPVLGSEFARAQLTSSATPELPSLAPLVKQVMPAVVSISVEEQGLAAQTNDLPGDDGQNGQQPLPGRPQGTPFDQLFRKFFEDPGFRQSIPALPPTLATPRQHEVALGSGFIIDPSGLVVTNNHLVAGARKVTVALPDGRKFTGEILGRDAQTDLALLKIKSDQKLPFVSWGDSDAAQPGDWVVAVGNPFGLGGTVSSGIISARGRDIQEGPYDDFLQIDAPINRGNSGGPSFNLQGQVIGINTAIYTPSGGNVGIAFAIPSNQAKAVIAELQEHGKVVRGWLGVQIQGVTPALAKAMGLAGAHGALVDQVTDDSPAAKAGIQVGDVIEAFDGHEIDKIRDLPVAAANTPAGTAVTVKLWRNDQQLTLGLTVDQQPADLAAMASSAGQGGSAEPAEAFGLHLAPLTPERRETLEIPSGTKGVVLRSIDQTSPLADLDLQPGDVIVAINQHDVATPRDADQLLAEAQAGPHKHLLLLIDRHGQNEYVAWADEGNQG